ncbi:MAG TPA: hypothetical protein VGQ90_11565 [Stellaceae bacterium]|jgi:hypothetical protein|nr:hypothetical protein [Stellaceae bacterium]
MRILLISAVVFAAASCAWAPPPAETAAPSPPAVAAAPPPAPFIIPPGQFWPGPLAWLFAPLTPRMPPATRLTLSNFTVDDARVQALITPFPDCVARPGTATTDFALPLNATRVIEAAPGSDVCWRRAVPSSPATAAAARAAPGWTEWNRVYLSSGRSIDSQL